MHSTIDGSDTTNDLTRRRSKRAEQTQIPGTERVCIAEVERAAIDYRSIRDERMDLTKKETSLRDALLAVMGGHGLEIYKYVDGENEEITVEVKTKSKVRVRKSDGASGDEDE
ncbi:MAG: hypothetical protein H0U52_06700 [Chloroflexi bacterium]|nr:hypothetical protein [Chloroflexota bacterium]